jgi:hypothetical protein
MTSMPTHLEGKEKIKRMMFTFAAGDMVEKLIAVADAEDRESHVKNGRVEGGRIGSVA